MLGILWVVLIPKEYWGWEHNGGGLCWLVLCVNLKQAGVITEKRASLEEMPP